MMRIILTLVCISLVTGALAQGEDNSLKDVPAKERMVFGGGFGLGFSNTQDYVMVSPSIGYMLTRKLMAGVNLSYQYTKYKFTIPSISVNAYGFGPFARFMIYDNLFLHTEYEYLNYQFPGASRSFDSFLAGGGFIQPLGSNTALYFLALYNFAYQTPKPGEFTPYGSPLVIRAGISLGGFGFN